MINNFFISTLAGVLIVATLGAILGGIILQKSAEAQGRLKTVLTKSGTGYLIWRTVTNLFYLGFISWYVFAALVTYRLKGFPNGANFVFECFLAAFNVSRLLVYNGVTLDTIFDKMVASWTGFTKWISPKPEAQMDLLEAIKHLDSKIFSDARTVKRKLADIGGPAVEPLLAALDNPDTDICTSAAEVLGWIGDTRAIVPLVAKIGGDRAISIYAAAALVV